MHSLEYEHLRIFELESVLQTLSVPFDLHRSCLFLPVVYCPKLRDRVGSHAYPLPEASRLPGRHPIIEEIRALQLAAERAGKDLKPEINRIMAGRLSASREPEAWRRILEAGTVPVSEFRRIAAALREALGLPSNRWIYPGNRVGELAIVCRRSQVSDFLLWPLMSLPVIVRESVIERLQRAGCTGYEVYPVRVVKYKGTIPPPPLYELSVTGRAGVPAPGSDPWVLQECSECGLTHTVSPLGKVAVDPEQYDGSDIFCFTPWDQVFVTARFVEAVSNPHLTGANFRPRSVSGPPDRV